jgi:hypothetical protein
MNPQFRLFPLALIVVGLFLLATKQGLIDPALLRGWWPLILVAVGVAGLLRPPRIRHCEARQDKRGDAHT